MKYLALLRGINVGGKNKIAMSELRQCFSDLGMKNVTTYINSGNIMFESEGPTGQLARRIEAALVQGFKFDSDIIKVLVLTKDELAAVVTKAPRGFGQEPAVYYSDVAFLIGVDSKEAFESFEVNPEVDKVWLGNGAVYYRRLGAKRTKSRLSKVISKPIYKSMTIRSWNTTTKLLALLTQNESASGIMS